jgi:hypothetical protein
MAAYSKAYQTVTAGRVREDEAIAFFGKNKVATPARVTNFNNLSAQKQPTLAKDHLAHEGIGKAGTTADNAAAYNPVKYQVS